MRQALFRIWLRWAVWATLFSLMGAFVVAFGMTLAFYLLKGAVSLEDDVLNALGGILLFWFSVCWSLALPLGTFLGMKQLFSRCVAGYRLQLFTCSLERVEKVQYSDVIKAWRKWLFLTIWGVAVGVLIITAVQIVMQGRADMSLWFHSYVLYILIMLSSLATLALMVRRCPSIVLERC